MPLSEEELRLLEQMERALVAEDPKFASALRGNSMQRATRARMIGAGVVFIVGIVLLMAGAVMQQTWLGIIGFVVMLGSATLGLTAWRGRQAQHDSAGPEGVRDAPEGDQRGLTMIEGGRAGKGKPRRPKQANHGSFMQRMETRWHRRRDNGF